MWTTGVSRIVHERIVALHPSQDTFEAPERRVGGELPVTALSILFHPDVDRIGEYVCLDAGTVELSRDAPELGHRGAVATPLEDRHVSRTPIRL